MSRITSAEQTKAIPVIAAALARNEAYFVEGRERPSPVVVTVDHATNHIPEDLGALGLTDADLARHIAYDVGAAGVGLALGRALNAPVVGSCFSRLVIDPNRGRDDPTLIMQLYDGTVIPGNHHLTEAGRAARITRFWEPYHSALDAVLSHRQGDAIIVSIHSFTERLQGRESRPWHLGILFAHDRRLSDPLLESLSTEAEVITGANEPYSGHLPGDSVDRHALSKGRLNALIELRQDLIVTSSGQQQWADLLARHLDAVLSDAKLNHKPTE